MLEVEPIGYVHSAKATTEDDGWGGLEATIILTDAVGPDALLGIEGFSHVEVLYVFHLVAPGAVERDARRPRGNPAWPRVGILAQRGRTRPNRIGATIARVLGHAGRELRVQGLDAVDGTPVLDIKPVMREFLPRESVRQPAWSEELMRHYWDEA